MIWLHLSLKSSRSVKFSIHFRILSLLRFDTWLISVISWWPRRIMPSYIISLTLQISTSGWDITTSNNINQLLLLQISEKWRALIILYLLLLLLRHCNIQLRDIFTHLLKVRRNRVIYLRQTQNLLLHNILILNTEWCLNHGLNRIIRSVNSNLLPSCEWLDLSHDVLNPIQK